ncbi:MAG: hypothetical protein KGL17_07245 [Betaproteobacteria bacterium]|nr:hypothetical protein [Betaproteobacteria bacterium]
MAATKTARALYNANPGANTTASATEWNLSTAYGGLLTVQIVNGASAPTTAPVVTVYTGNATGVKRQLMQFSGDLVASSTNPYSISLPPAAMYVNVDVKGGATNGSTFTVEGQELTSV